MSSSDVSAARDEHGEKWGLQLRITVAILCGALFLDAMDVSSVNVALPTIGSHLRMSASSLQWVVSGYVLGYGGFLLLGGRASDLLGRRRVFLTALAIFAVASAVGGAANDGTLLVATRFIKGVGAAFTVPAGLSILTTTFPEGAARNKALGAYGATAAGGFSLGLVIGGLLSELGWRYVFLLPAPFALVLIIAGARVLNVGNDASLGHRHYDMLGSLTVTASMLALVYSVVEAPSHGWLTGRTLGGLALSVLLLAAFVAIESRSPHPLVRLGILRTRTLVSADIAAMLYFGSYLGFQFLATLYVQYVAGWSPIDTALAFLPSGAFLPILGSQAERLIGRFGTRRLIAAGLTAFAIGYALLLREHSHHLAYTTMLLPSMIVIGLGWGLGFPALNVQATAAVADAEQGLAAGLFNTAFQIGGAIFVAVVSAVVSSHTTAAGGGEARGILDAMRPAIAILIPVALVGTVVLFTMRRTRSTTESAEVLRPEFEAG
ncbi:MAG TPA: MFS transporter [Solirubrobacteraceae bacterium]|nr:MFS transporter [Solirubrobacteraceae bacterium]